MLNIKKAWFKLTHAIGEIVGAIGGVIMAAVHAYLRPWLWLFEQVRGLWDGLGMDRQLANRPSRQKAHR